jgi:hypothetical protein
MKNPYKIVVIVVLMVFGTFFNQVKAQSKKEVVNIKVEGVCGECTARIESALDLKGVKIARYDLETNICEVVYNPQKIDEMDLHKALVAVGHKTDKMDVLPEVYNSLSNCCKYLEEKKH